MVAIGSVGSLPALARAVESSRAEQPDTRFEAQLRGAENAAARSAHDAPGRAASGSERVTIQRTRLSGSQAADALSKAWQQLEGGEPSEETLAILTAQWSHETGRGASMLNYNFGGIKGTSPEGMSIAARTHEGWGATRRQIVDDFRAYSTPEQGAHDYVSLLKRRYPDAVTAATSGDPAQFVRELKAGGYFTGNEQAYAKSVTQLANVALARGFDALSDADASAEGVPERLTASRSFAPLATRDVIALPGALRALLPTRGAAVHEVDVSALADELSRAALRIVPSGTETEDELQSIWGGTRRS